MVYVKKNCVAILATDIAGCPFIIRCVSDMYNDHAEGIEVDTIPGKLEDKS